MLKLSTKGRYGAQLMLNLARHQKEGRESVILSADEKIKALEANPATQRFGTCMAKTHLSLSYDPGFKGRPIGWQLPIRDVLVYKGAEFVVPLAGEVKLMPGTGSDPAFRRIDVDVNTGRVRGL